jgi:hypothetical protein
MSYTKFSKTLSANDVGATGSHQAGILVPKSNQELLAFFPLLDKAQKNPDAWITCKDEAGNELSLRYIYYNTKIHGAGTRNEYRITRLTAYLRERSVKPGDSLQFEATNEPLVYRISISRNMHTAAGNRILLRGWRKVH